jgi:hypothetical protein
VYARAVDQVDTRLRELRHEACGDLTLAAAAFVSAVVATEVLPRLAAPLFIGGLAVAALGVRAIWRRWDLLERMSAERDAHVISEVRDFASREATMERRQCFATRVRGSLREASFVADARVLAVADELEALASELENGDLAFEPACAVACMRLLSDVAQSPLLDHASPPEELRSRIRQIRSGFRPRSR